MIKIKDYIRAGSLEEAYELNQKRSACILGGMLWTKMGERQVQTAIDLSGLGLDQIEESEEEFSIGCMVTLRQMEEHEGLNVYTDGAARECVRSIVGVQFRNLATVGRQYFRQIWIFGCADAVCWRWIQRWSWFMRDGCRWRSLPVQRETGMCW